MPVIGTGPRNVELGMGSDVDQEKEVSHPGDPSDSNVVHRHDKTSFRQDLERLECACDVCTCGDITACIHKKCGCCTVSK
jgi:hypothetical protein